MSNEPYVFVAKYFFHNDNDFRNIIFRFVLNTSIELPHENGVNALQFQPNTTFDDGEWLTITTGKDNKFKLWNLGKSSIAQSSTYTTDYSLLFFVK